MTSDSLVLRGAETLEVDVIPSALEHRDETLSVARTVLTVDTPAEAELAAESIRDLRWIERQVEAARTAVKAPVLDIGRKIDAKAKEFVSPLGAEIARINALLTGFQRRQEEERRKAEEERQRKIREAQAEEARKKREAEEQERRDREAAEEAARKAKEEGDPFAEAEAAAAAQRATEQAAGATKEAAAEAQAAITAAVISTAPAVAPQRVEGVGIRRHPDFEVTDIRALAAARPDLVTITPKAAVILGVIRAGKEFEGRRQIVPGVLAWWDSKAIVR